MPCEQRQEAGEEEEAVTERDFEAFVTLAYDTMLHTLRRDIGDKADDVFQRTVLSFLRPTGNPPIPSYRRYTGGGRFVPLFKAALRNAYVDFVRERQAGTWKDHVPGTEGRLDDAGLGDVRDADDGGAVELKTDISQLPPRQQEAVSLLAEGRTLREVGSALGISHQSVYRLRRRAQRRLQRRD